MHAPARRPGRGAARAAVGATAVSLAVVALPAPASAAPTAPYVSEIHYDDVGVTRGAVDPAPTPRPQVPATDACDVPAGEVTAIGAVQGSGAATPLAGRTVTVRGTVVGDLQGAGGLEGFHLQDAGDGDTATSDGVFVLSTVPVAFGDEVAVTGVPSESFGQTQVTAPTDVGVCGGDLLREPQAAFLDLPAGDDVRERLEGMRVEPADDLTVSEVFALTRFGELTLSEGGVLVQPTELARPGTEEAAAVATANAARTVLLDDGRDDSTSVRDRPYLSPSTPVRVGDVARFEEPLVLGYGFGEWRLQPADGTADGVLAPQDTRTGAPGPVGGDVRLGTFNVLNYFLTWTGPDARGARNAAQFDKQADKIVSAISALEADVVTLLEVEDTDSTGWTPGNADTALADLVDRLDEAAGADVWAYVPMPRELYDVDRDVIRNGIVYRTDVVQPVGEPVGLADESVWANAREPQAQTFSEDGDAFTVVANHFKSKNDSEPPQSGNDNADSGDGQGAFTGDRVRQAQSVAAFAGRLAQETGDPDVVLMGDLNAYTREDPVEVLRGAGYTDLGEQFDPGRYSYVFDGLSGSLDHAMASASLTAKVEGVSHWAINSVESSAYQYTGDPDLYAPDPYRSSDHDPLVVGIDLEDRCQGLVPRIRGTEGDDVLRGTDGRDVVMGLGGDDVLQGGNADDILCGGAGRDTVSGDNGADVLVGGLGADVLDGGNGDDALIGGPGEDVLEEGRGNDTRQPEGPES